MLRFSFLFIFLLPSICFAQLKITGKIVNADDKKPVANASVFLNNASTGNKTANDGTFTLNNVRPGQYDLIVSIVGYETHSQSILVNNSNINLPEIALKSKTIELNEVKIKPDPNWERYYTQFKRQFLGTTANAAQCRILNPDILDFQYDKKTHTLEASSYDFLEIENKALGYVIKYKLNTFSYDANKGFMYYDGVSVFEDMKGNNGKIRKWQKRRQDAYLGSPMHFLRSIVSNRLTPEGFEVLKLIRKPNPEYKGGLFDNKNKYIQMLVKQPLNLSEFAKRTDNAGLYALGFTDCLYIMYNKKNSGTSGDIYRPLDMPDYATSIATLDEHEAYAFFDNNGIINNPRSIIFEGDWGIYRMAEMLPVNYEPPAQGK
ncbi:carboxypeptidase-like regulatory domain-containing protein [Mucilaginibacter lappiensis]|uniref:carboxypeptidase-like regulatory domain-containing protein n=1 Tax=Mucilaginibacter lappiensis TaxID=354630 RepID=UPI003D22E8C1